MTGRDSVRHSTNNESITKSVKESSEQSDNDHDNNKDNAEQTRQQDQQQYDEDDSNSNPINPDPLPRGPPPPPTTTNYLLETKGSPSPTLAADLARKRPLDPVFRQAEASFPKLLGTTGDPIGTTSTPSTLLSNNNVSIFVPTLNSSRKEEDDENDDDDEMPSENDTANDNPEQMPEEPINDEKSIQEEEEEEDATAYIQDSIAVEEEVVLETIDNEHEHQRLQEKEELIEDDHEHDDETSKDPQQQQQQQQQEEDQVEYEEKGETSIITQPSKATKATKPSRFVFLSDQNTVPSDLKRLQEKTRQRRRELKNQFYDLEYRLGLSASKYAEEKMDLGLAIRDTFDRTVCRPLEASMERIVMEQETDMHSKPAIRQLEQRLERLDKLMMRHVHVSMNDAKREELDMLHQDLRREIIPGIRVEKSKADKLERGVISRYELNAGAVTKRFHHESAARRAQIEVVGQRLKQTIDDHEMRSSNVLEVIASLREQIKREREERRQADQKIMEEIDKTSVAMKRAFLAAIDDSK